MNDTTTVAELPPIEKDDALSRLGLIHGSGAWNSPYKWLVKNLIPDNAIGFIGGAAASGKTFAAIDIMAGVITGQPVLDYYPVQRSGIVIYCAVEGRQGIAHRFEAYRQSRNIEQELWDKRLVQTVQLFRFTSMDVPQFIAYIHAVEKKLGDKVVLVVFDTFRTFSGINDENGSGDAQEALTWMRYVAIKGNCSVMAIHHSGKNTDNPTRPGDDFHKVLRGSSDFGSSAEFVIGVAQAETESGEVISWLWPAKLKDVKPEPPRAAPIDSHQLSITGQAEPLSVGVIACDIDPSIELAESVVNPRPGQPSKAGDDARTIADYARSGKAPATLTDCRNALKTALKARGVTNGNTINTRVRKALDPLRGDPWRYQVEWLDNGNQLRGV